MAHRGFHVMPGSRVFSGSSSTVLNRTRAFDGSMFGATKFQCRSDAKRQRNQQRGVFHSSIAAGYWSEASNTSSEQIGFPDFVRAMAYMRDDVVLHVPMGETIRALGKNKEVSSQKLDGVGVEFGSWARNIPFGSIYHFCMAWGHPSSSCSTCGGQAWPAHLGLPTISLR